MITKPQPKTRADLIRERGEQIGWQYEMAAKRQAEQAAIDEDRAAFARRVQAGRAGVASAIARVEASLPDSLNEAQRRAAIEEARHDALAETRASIQGFDQIFEEKRTAELATEEAERAARLAAISPHDRWTNSLDYSDREKVGKYEKLFGLPHPLAPPE